MLAGGKSLQPGSTQQIRATFFHLLPPCIISTPSAQNVTVLQSTDDRVAVSNLLHHLTIAYCIISPLRNGPRQRKQTGEPACHLWKAVRPVVNGKAAGIRSGGK